MMDLSSGLPYFWILNGLPHRYPTLQRDLRCDVVVVGGGITGALCAHACATSGIGVTVLDARPIGTGSTAASTALLQYELDTPLHELIGRVGEQRAVRAYHLAVEAVDELMAIAQDLGAASAQRRMSVQYASRRSHAASVRKEFAVRRSHGLDAELLDTDALRRWFPALRTIALMNRAAAELDPCAFTHLLLQEVIRLGGNVFERTDVVHWERSPAGTFTVHAQGGRTVQASHLVLATGYESQRYLPRPLLHLHSTYAVASARTDRDSLWHDDCLLWETAQPYLYFRTTPDRRAIVGGLDMPFRDPARRDALLDRKCRRLARCFQRVIPDVPFVPEYAWCGTFGTTADGLPYVDRDPRTGAWFVLGMGGNGITFSRTGAVIVRNAILGKPDADASLFRFDR